MNPLPFFFGLRMALSTRSRADCADFSFLALSAAFSILSSTDFPKKLTAWFKQ